MSLLQFIQQSGNVVTRRVSGAVFQWMLLVSNAVDTLVSGGAALEAQTRYVAVDGNDTTGTGSRAAPFLTVARAMTSITDADTVTKPYIVKVGPGIFATAFSVKAGTYVVGAGSGSGNFNGSPLTAITTVAPTAAQVLDASFAGAGTKSGGIMNCAMSTNLVASFAAIGSTGQGTFILDDVLTENLITLTGAGAAGASVATLRDVYLNATVDMTISEISETVLSGIFSDFGGKLIFNQSAAIQSFHYISEAFFISVTANWTSALIANFMQIVTTSPITPNGSVKLGIGIVINGDGIVFASQQCLTLTMTDAANRLSFGNNALATLNGVNTGENIIECTPTANRLLTIDLPASYSRATIIKIRNLATNPAFNVDFAFPLGTVLAGSPTYCPAGGQVNITFDFVNNSWLVEPYVQSGTVTLSNGVSVLIPADIAAGSDIVASLRDFNAGVLGAMVSAKLAGRVVGSRAGGGGFVLTSVTTAGVTVTTDQGIYDWHVNG